MNKDLAIEKGLIVNNSNELYLKIENFYKCIFESILVSCVDLKKYDDKIYSSDYYFGVPKPNEKQLISGLNEYLNLKYIFLVNNFFIEKLSVEDIEILKNKLLNNSNTIDQELFELVKRTYKDIISYNNPTGNTNLKIAYGSSIPSHFAPYNALVFKIYYSKNTKRLDDESFVKNIVSQKHFMADIKVEIENEIKNKMDVPVFIIDEKIPN